MRMLQIQKVESVKLNISDVYKQLTVAHGCVALSDQCSLYINKNRSILW